MGFATLPNQVHRKSVKKGFDFTLMVAGQFQSGHANSTEHVPSLHSVASSFGKSNKY